MLSSTPLSFKHRLKGKKKAAAIIYILFKTKNFFDNER